MVYGSSLKSGISSDIFIINTETHQVSKTFRLSGSAFGVAFNPKSERAYVPLFYDNALGIISTTLEEQITTLTGFNTPRAVAVAPQGTFALVTNYLAGTVSVVQL